MTGRVGLDVRETAGALRTPDTTRGRGSRRVPELLHEGPAAQDALIKRPPLARAEGP